MLKDEQNDHSQGRLLKNPWVNTGSKIETIYIYPVFLHARYNSGISLFYL